MITFIAGVFTGAVVAVFAMSILHVGKSAAADNVETTANPERLNKEKEHAEEKRRREEKIRDLDRQWDRMMRYTGKDQHKE